MKVKSIYLFIYLFIFIALNNNSYAQSKIAFEEISVVVEIEGVKSIYTINALISPDEKLYISVEDLFGILIIPCSVNKEGNILNGFIENEKRRYEINSQTKKIKDNAKIYNCENELIINEGVIYLESAIYEKIFGLHIKFNFRSLGVKLTSDFELPVKKAERLAQNRSSIQKSSSIASFDETYKRNYHLFRYGTIDWSVMSSQTKNNPAESRFNINLGSELLYGESNIFLNFSDKSKQDARQQQFSWRWVDNEKTIIRQFLVGNISNNTISSLNSPIHGISITNTPTSIRKAKGEYIINDITQPDWSVELYMNNVLIDYTKADAAGHFTFKIPITYGYNILKLKFYGPMGEERSDERIMNVPNNFTPSGSFEYKINGGLLQNDNNDYLIRSEGNYGITRFLTIGGGIERLTSIKNINSIPFINTSMLLMNNLMLSGEYAHKVQTTAQLNYYLWSSAMIEIGYTKYTEGQQAIIFNYLEEKKVEIAIPIRYKSLFGNTRFSYKQNVYKNFNFNMASFILSAAYHQLNANLSSNANWINNQNLYLNSNAALSVRLPKELLFRTSAQINLNNSEIISYKTELEKKFYKAGYWAFSYERNIASAINSFNLSFKYNFSFAQINIFTRTINKEFSMMESAKGSIAIDNKKLKINTTQQTLVGRGGINFLPYVDVNHNNKYDQGEKRAIGLVVRINGGRPFIDKKDTLIRIIGLEPFIYYNVEFDEKDFEFITWRLPKRNFRILIDPNQFKTIEIPISPVAEITGTILFDDDTTQKGKGRISVIIYNKDDSTVAKIISESDGYISHLGLLPGEYYAKIDPVQLERLQMEAKPAQLNFTIKENEEGDVFNGVDFILKKIKSK